jgi:hypothetical protein
MRRIGLILGLVAVAAAAIAGGNDPRAPKGTGQGAGAGRDDKLPLFTPEREAAAMTFVRQNHPELGKLLGQLKSSNADAYERAVRELFRTSEQLADMRGRDPRRYELDLAAWKLNSRIQLLAARRSMTNDPTVEDELRSALHEQIDVRVEQHLLERERAAARVEKLDAMIRTLRDGEDQDVEKRLVRLLRNAGKPAGAESK